SPTPTTPSSLACRCGPRATSVCARAPTDRPRRARQHDRIRTLRRVSDMSYTNSNASTPIMRIDSEMTGLDHAADALIEVAAVVTASELNPLGDGVSVVIRPPDAALEQMNDFVPEMHTSSGLLEDLPAGLTMAEGEQIVLDY